MKSIRNEPSQEEIDRFWRQVKQEIKQIPLAFERKQQPALLTGIDVYQVISKVYTMKRFTAIF